MEIIKDTVLMRDPSTLCFDSFEADTNPYAVGIILALPLQATSLKMMNCLISITCVTSLPVIVRAGSLCKFFRHFSDIQRYVDVIKDQENIFSLLSEACQLMNVMINECESAEISSFLLKSFKQAIERLTYELRTKVEVLNLVTCAMKYKIFSDFPSKIFKIPLKVIENALNCESLSFQQLMSTVEDIWRIMKTSKTPDSDPIKNISFFLTSQVLKKTESPCMSQTSSLLHNYSGQLSKSQEFKVLLIYKQLCSRIGCDVDSSICAKLGEVSKNFEAPSAWDLVDEAPVYMEVQVQETLAEATERVVNGLKSIHSKEYLKHYIIEKEVLGISKTFRKDQPLIVKNILELVDKDQIDLMRFWKTFCGAARKLRFFSFDEIKAISEQISNVERRKTEPLKNQPVLNKLRKSRESLNLEIRDTVDGNTPDRKTFEDIQNELTHLESEIKAEFQLCEVVCIGSLECRLYLKNTPVDILVQSNESLEESQNFEARLETFLKSFNEVRRVGNHLQLVGKVTVNVYTGSKIPRVTSALITRYVTQSQAINTFLTYVKVWTKTLPLNQHPGGYFWTVLAIFYLCNTSPPVIKNLTPDVLHQAEALDGFDVWVDPEDYPCLKADEADLFIGFVSFLNCNQSAVFNTETGEIEKSSEFLWAVSDFFTKRILTLDCLEATKVQAFLNEVWESLKGIERINRI